MKEKWVLRHCDLDLWSEVTEFNRVRASVISNHLAKTASKSVHPFSWNFVHKKCWTHRHTATQTNWSENVTPPLFRGGVIMILITYIISICQGHSHPVLLAIGDSNDGLGILDGSQMKSKAINLEVSAFSECFLLEMWSFQLTCFVQQGTLAKLDANFSIYWLSFSLLRLFISLTKETNLSP